MPEQCIQFGDALGDPFSSTSWPTAAEWNTIRSNRTGLVSWLQTHAPGFIVTSGAEQFAVRAYELIDGLSATASCAIGVWHIGPATSGSVSFSIADLPGQSTSGGLFRLDLGNGDGQGLDINTTRLVDGGTFSTLPVATDVVMRANDVALLFNAPIHSPSVIRDAVATIPAGQPRTGVLQIRASHWNGQELSVLRIEGRDAENVDMGWGAVVELHDADHDGIYTASVTNGPGVSAGPHTFRAVAIGNDGLRTYADVVITAEEVPDISISSTATHSLLAESHDGKIVLAVGVTSYVPLSSTLPAEVVAPTIFGNSTPVALWDDGPDARPSSEDEIAGDGIFTSDRVPGAVHIATTFSASVIVHPVAGNSVSGTVSVTSVLSRAEFADKTASSGAIGTNEGVPRYAMAYANTSSDRVTGKKIMVVTFADAGTFPQILENQSRDGSAADFAFRHDNWIGGGANHLPNGSRGVCFGDFGRLGGGAADGKQDFFLCGATGSHLYVNSGTVEAPQFVDVIEAAFPLQADRDRLVGAMSAAWSDFDLDGDLDLFVATSDYSGPMNEIATQVGVTYGGAFFTNNGNGQFAFKSVGMLTGAESGLTGVWANLDPSKRWPYLVLPWISSGNCLLAYCFDGGLPYKVIEVTGGQLSNLNSIVVCDYNHDNRPDLLVTDHGGAGKAAILRNDYNPATGAMSFHVACTLGAGRKWSGATAADFDGNGQDDILLLPESGAPALYMAVSASTTPAFIERAFTLGLRAGATSGCVATDLGASRLPDICLGRSGERSLYENLRSATGPDPRHWVDISLGTVGNSNSSLIGATVTVTQGNVTWQKVVDGGSGRGGQDPNDLRFFLGEDAGSVAVSVGYPSGDSDTFTSVPVDSTYAALEDTPVTLKTGTTSDPDPTFSYELGPGTMDWIFRWRTVGIKGDQRQDAVTVENYMGYDEESPCYIGIEPGTSLVLRWGDPGVTFDIHWDGADWVHEARWSIPMCTSNCRYRFKVTSGLGNGMTTTSAQAKAIPRLDFCLPVPIEP